MKKVLLLLGIVLSFALVSCADDPFNPAGQKLTSGNVQISLDDNPSKAGGIVIGSSQVTNAVIRLTGPTGIVQTATWTVGASKTFMFNADVTGAYTLALTQTDTSNYTATTNVPCSFVAGYNYYIAITLGGNVIVNIGTNGVLPPSSSVSSVVSSVASSVSSVASSVSSVASSSSSSVAATIAKVYTERTTGTQLPMDPSWEVWPGTGDSVVFTPVIGAFEGFEAIECSKGNLDWLGFVIKSLTNSSGIYADLTGYIYLNVALKATPDFPMNIQVGCGQAGTVYQKWYDVALVKDGNWHTYQITITNIAPSLLANMQWIFAMRSKAGSPLWSVAPSSTITFDDVYYSR